MDVFRKEICSKETERSSRRSSPTYKFGTNPMGNPSEQHSYVYGCTYLFYRFVYLCMYFVCEHWMLHDGSESQSSHPQHTIPNYIERLLMVADEWCSLREADARGDARRPLLLYLQTTALATCTRSKCCRLIFLTKNQCCHYLNNLFVLYTLIHSTMFPFHRYSWELLSVNQRNRVSDNSCLQKQTYVQELYKNMCIRVRVRGECKLNSATCPTHDCTPLTAPTWPSL